MPFIDFVEQSEYIERAQETETKRGYIYQAYGSWLQGHGEKKSFGEYLNSLGLSEKKPKLTTKQKRKIAQHSIAVARKILKMKAVRKKK